MIYISSSCITKEYIKDSALELYQHGFKNIELSGGTKYYANLMNDIIKLKHELQLNLLCHNYFPPSEEPFVLNLASLNDDLFYQSLKQLKKGIILSKKINAKKFGFHAGFLIDIAIDEIGKEIHSYPMANQSDALDRFCSGFEELKKESAGEVDIYIENNVLSLKNYINFNKMNPFFLTDYVSYNELKSQIDFKLLLDIAHLKVSCNSLGIDFENELVKLLPLTDYVHISDNDGTIDNNMTLKHDSLIMDRFRNLSLPDTFTITIEVYENIEHVKRSYEIIQSIFK